MLDKSKQAHFVTIEEFSFYITQILQRLAIYQNLSKKEISRKVEQHFMQGLQKECL